MHIRRGIRGIIRHFWLTTKKIVIKNYFRSENDNKNANQLQVE